ncbi:unnamed protein product, partial [Symbiodinium pilosum]
DALLEALQDAPDVVAQAAAFKARSEGARALHKSAERKTEEEGANSGCQMRASAAQAQATTRGEVQSFDVEAAGAAGRRRAKGRSWRGTMAVILVSLVIWAILLTVWSPPELWPHVPDASTATGGQAKEVVRSTPKPIQLPGRSNETLAAVIASPRGRVNVSWASLDISGNLSEETQNSTGGGRPNPFRRKGRRADGIGH